jgi:LacI family transcriptional regulator
VARQLRQNVVLRVAFLFPEPGSGSGYWDTIIAGIHSAADTFKPFNIEIIPAFFNRAKKNDMLSVGEALLLQQPDALILSPVVSDDALALTAKMRDIPYVYVDSPLAGANPLVTIAQSPYRAGFCAGRIMQLMRGSGVFVCLRMFNSAYNLRERIRGFTDYFAHDSATRVFEMESATYDYKDLFAFMDRLFARHKAIHGIFVPHAEVHLIAAYLTERGLKNDITLIGFDNLSANRRALLDGAIDCLISQRAENQGYQALCEIYRWCVLRQSGESVIEIPIDVCFKENV